MSLREEKINTEVKRELSVLIGKLKDPRIPDLTTVVKVNVTRDLKIAKAHISIMGDESVKKDAIKGLKSASSFLRREIAQNLSLRVTPELFFILDDSIEHGAHILNLIKKVSKENKKGEE